MTPVSVRSRGPPVSYRRARHRTRLPSTSLRVVILGRRLGSEQALAKLHQRAKRCPGGGVQIVRGREIPADHALHVADTPAHIVGLEGHSDTELFAREEQLGDCVEGIWGSATTISHGIQASQRT
jgi:hypothetical protein